MNKYSKTIKYIEAQYYKERFYQPIKKHKIIKKSIEILCILYYNVCVHNVNVGWYLHFVGCAPHQLK